MNEKEKTLIAALNALLAQHGAKLVCHDDYDGEDNLCGSHVNIEGNGIYIPLESLADES